LKKRKRKKGKKNREREKKKEIKHWMQDETILSKSPFGPPVSLQYRSGDPPYPSSQYPP